MNKGVGTLECKQWVIWQVRLKHLYKMNWLHRLNNYHTSKQHKFEVLYQWCYCNIYSDMNKTEKGKIFHVNVISQWQNEKMAKKWLNFTKWPSVFFMDSAFQKWPYFSKLAMKWPIWLPCSAKRTVTLALHQSESLGSAALTLEKCLQEKQNIRFFPAEYTIHFLCITSPLDKLRCK